MSEQHYVLSNTYASPFEIASQALRVALPYQFVMFADVEFTKHGEGWVVSMTLQVHFSEMVHHGWTLIDVFVRINKTVMGIHDSGPIPIEVRAHNSNPDEPAIAEIAVWKGCYDPDNPLSVQGQMHILAGCEEITAIKQFIVRGVVSKN